MHDFKHIKPMLATPHLDPFDSPEYAFEVKWDGIRALAHVGSSLKLYSRYGRDITRTYPELAEIANSVSAGTVLDGEIVLFFRGLPHFGLLIKRHNLANPRNIQNVKDEYPVTFLAFDVLFYKDKSLLSLPFIERKKILQECLRPEAHVAISEHILKAGTLLYQAVLDKGLEGIVAKKLSSRYFPGKRSRFWLKIRNKRLLDLVVCGYTLSTGRAIGSILLAAYDDHKLTYVGRVGTGFSEEDEKLILGLPKLNEYAATKVPRDLMLSSVPVVPKVVCRIEALTGDNLRHASFKELRPDIRPAECKMKKE